jgi:hypothetical protein
LQGTRDLVGLCTCADECCVTGVRRDRGTGVSDLQHTAREATLQMIGSQRVRKRHFQGHSQVQRTDFDEQGYQQYSHIVRVSSTLEASKDCLQIREQCAYPSVYCLVPLGEEGARVPPHTRAQPSPERTRSGQLNAAAAHEGRFAPGQVREAAGALARRHKEGAAMGGFTQGDGNVRD